MALLVLLGRRGVSTDSFFSQVWRELKNNNSDNNEETLPSPPVDLCKQLDGIYVTA